MLEQVDKKNLAYVAEEEALKECGCMFLGRRVWDMSVPSEIPPWDFC